MLWPFLIVVSAWMLDIHQTWMTSCYVWYDDVFATNRERARPGKPLTEGVSCVVDSSTKKGGVKAREDPSENAGMRTRETNWRGFASVLEEPLSRQKFKGFSKEALSEYFESKRHHGALAEG